MKNFLSLVIMTAVLLPIPDSALADDAAVPPFSMTVLVDQAHGRKIVNGSFARAISKLANNAKTPTKHESLTNLCVAYAKAKQIDEAFQSCDAAIDLLQEKLQRYDGRRASEEDYRLSLASDLSIALSNRGVLYAVKGDLGRARENFKAAISLPTDRSRADDNLRRLSAIES